MRSRLLLLLAGTLAGLLLAEAGVRLLGFEPPPAPRRVVYAGRSTEWCCGPEVVIAGVHRFEPKASFAHCYSAPWSPDFDASGCVSYRINGQGFRGAEFAPKKPAGVYRIVILGDSFSFGEGTPEDAIYPTRLGEALRGRRAGGPRIEVVNLGMPGDSAREARAIWRGYARGLGADHVVFQWNTNDFPSSAVQQDHLRLIGVAYRQLHARVEALRWSRLLSFAYARLEAWRIARELVTTTREDAERGRESFAEIGRLRREVEDAGAGFTLLAFPELIRFDDYPYAAIVDALRDYCRREEIVLVDLLPALSLHRDRELWVHETDHHPNPSAHAIAARELAAALERVLPAPGGPTP